MHFHYMIYLAMLLHKNPCPGILKFTILVEPSLVFITVYLAYLIYAQV